MSYEFYEGIVYHDPPSLSLSKLMEKSSYWPFRKEFTEPNSILFIIIIDELTPKLKNEEI
jgi:hypothetical protein